MHKVTMPRLSDSMEEGILVRWLKPDASSVLRGDELAEIESEKAKMPFESPLTGFCTT